MNKAILIVVAVLVIGVLGFVLMRHNSKVAMTNQPSYQPATSTTYQNTGTTANTPATGNTNPSTSATTTAPTDLSKTNLDSSLQGLDSQVAGIDANSDDLSF